MTEPTALPKKYANEQVLVIPRRAIEQAMPRTGVLPVTEQLLQLVFRATPMQRALAEESVEFTQLVAYFIVTADADILTHRRSRRQPEKRLTDVRAIGFSGHMNERDLQTLSSRDLFHGNSLSGYANRELAEEVKVKTHSDKPIALRCCIWDPSDDLGRQHIGLVYEVPTSGEFEILEPGLITDAKFESLTSIRERLSSYTSWSQLLAYATASEDLLSQWRSS